MFEGLTYEEYVKDINSFLDISKKLNDGWSLCEVATVPTSKYLSKKDFIKLKSNIISESELPYDEELSEYSESFESDDAAVEIQDDKDHSDEFVSMEYHILYSQSYAVPVLYFNVTKMNGQLLQLLEIWDSIPDRLFKERLNEDPWTVLTQVEHPLLQVPFFMIHPCKTSDLMSKIFSRSESNNYIVSWLSSISPLVALKLDNDYADLC